MNQVSERPVVTMQNYVASAMRTNSTVTGTFDIPGDVLHAALGLADEYFENKIANTSDKRVEELGDSLWFIALACHGFQLTPAQVASVFEPIPASALWDLEVGTMEYELGEFIGPVKKWFTYGKALSAEWAVVQLRKIIIALYRELEQEGRLTRTGGDEEVVAILQMNIDKLWERFPEKFTVEKALNRDTDAEYAAMGLEK